MSLDADGVTDVGCQPTTVLETALGSDVYETVADYVRSEYGARGTLFGWDWRKRPQPSFTKLEEAIDDGARPSTARGSSSRPAASCSGGLLRRPVHPRVHRGLRAATGSRAS